jgi:hypothetical protein
MASHRCRLTGSHGELVFICSRCGKCYECRHKLIYLDEARKYMWKCPDGKLRPVINDGRLREP